MILECPKDECGEATNVPKTNVAKPRMSLTNARRANVAEQRKVRKVQIGEERVREYNAKPNSDSLPAEERRWSWKPASSYALVRG